MVGGVLKIASGLPSRGTSRYFRFTDSKEFPVTQWHRGAKCRWVPDTDDSMMCGMGGRRSFRFCSYETNAEALFEFLAKSHNERFIGHLSTWCRSAVPSAESPQGITFHYGAGQRNKCSISSINFLKSPSRARSFVVTSSWL